MPRPNQPPSPAPRLVPGLTREGKPSSHLVPAPPPMQVVTKGWWVLRTEEVSTDELMRQEQQEQ
jgi:hypothetical protein